MLLPEDLVARVDLVAGSRGRTGFVVRALESALSEGASTQSVPNPSVPPLASASSRASVLPYEDPALHRRVLASWRDSSSVKAGVRPIPKKGAR